MQRTEVSPAESLGASAGATRRSPTPSSRNRDSRSVATPRSRAARRARQPTTQTVLARAVTRLVELAVAEGMNREALIEAAGLRRVDLTDGDARVPVSTQVAVWRLIARAIADPSFGVRGGASIKVREMGLLGYIMSYSGTLEAALRRLIRYSRIINDAAELTLERPDRNQVAVVPSQPALGAGLPFAVDYRLAVLLSVCRQITGVRIIPCEMSFNYGQPATTLQHRSFFSCPLRFGQPESRIVFVERDLGLPVLQGDETLAGYLSEYAEQVLRSLVMGTSFRERVRSAIWAALGEGRPTLRGVASALQLPARTLQRRLADEGTSLLQEVEEIRRTMAMAMLQDRAMSIDEVAVLLGYAEPSTLFRSFRRWTNMTPRQYRVRQA
jgi:AraC-like DNA-binding protein